MVHEPHRQLRRGGVEQTVTGASHRVTNALSLDDALMTATAAAHQLERLRVRDAVMRAGHRLLDASPAQLPVRLVNDYWQLKRSGRL